MNSERRVIARFVPQAWVGDYAIDIDPGGPEEWDATEGFNDLDAEYRAILLEEIEVLGEALDNHDALAEDSNAPEWVLRHNGPFSLYLRLA